MSKLHRLSIKSHHRYKVGTLYLVWESVEIISRICLPNECISVTVGVRAFCPSTLTMRPAA